MGFLSGIGKAFSGAVKGITSAVGSISKLAQGIGGIVDKFSKIAGPLMSLMGGGIPGLLGGNMLSQFLGGMSPFGGLPIPGMGGQNGGQGFFQNLLSSVLGGGSPFGQGGPMGGLTNLLGGLLGGGQGSQGAGGVGQGGFGGLFPPMFPGSPSPLPAPAGGEFGGFGNNGGGAGFQENGAAQIGQTINGLEKKIANLDPNSPNYHKDLMDLTKQMHKMEEMFSLLMEMQKMKHRLAMKAINSINQ